MKKFLFLGLVIVFSLMLTNLALAQENVDNNVPAEVNVDSESSGAVEDVTASELGVAEDPVILPSSPFYFLKNLGRTIQQVFTFNPEKKAELKLKEASTRLWEAEKMAEQNPNDVKTQALIEKSHLKYQELMQKVHQEVKKIKAGDLSAEQIERLKQIKEQALERYGDLMEKVENKENVKARLDRVLENKEGDGIIQLKNLEIMERLGDKLSDENFKEKLLESKEIIRDKIIDQLKENPDDGKAEVFKAKLEGLVSNEADQGYGLRVFNFLSNKLDEEVGANGSLNRFREKLDNVRDKSLENFKNRLEKVGSDGEKAELLKPLEAGEMNSIEVLEQVKTKVKNSQAKEALGNAQERQVENLNNRIEKVDDPSRMEMLKESINEKPVIKNRFQRNEPGMLKNLNEKAELRNNENSDKVESKEFKKPEERLKILPSTGDRQSEPADNN